VASGDLFSLANEYLNACLAALADTPGGPPQRYFVSPGPPAWDCPEMLAVHVGGPAVADTFPLQPVLASMHRIAVNAEVDIITMTATILRCGPALDNDTVLPSPQELDQLSLQTLSDVWCIWNYVKSAVREKVLFVGESREIAFESAIAVNQEGGTAGWQVPIRVQLHGYRAAV
jgi:hypothetical protein